MTYGYRMITEGIRIKYGVIFNNKKVQRIMNKYYLKPKYIKRIILNNYKRIEENVNSNVFIEFMLKMIDEVLDSIVQGVNKQINHISSYVKKLLDVMEYGVKYKTSELMEKLGMKSRVSFKENYLDPAIKNGLIKMSYLDNPTNKN